MEEYAKKVHEAWCDRKAEEIRKYMNDLDSKGLSDSEIMAKVDDKYSWDKNLMVAYENLSEEEKQKDRNHVIEAVKINKEISHLYTSYVGNYIMDISKEVEEYLKEELGEDYPKESI